MLGRFTRSLKSLDIAEADVSRFRVIVLEVADLLKDHISDSKKDVAQLAMYANDAVNNYLGTPSYSGIENVRDQLTSLLTRIKRNSSVIITNAGAPSHGNSIALEKLTERLPIIIRELRRRRENRSTLDVRDEYDLQDLLRALLMMNFDDVRSEEWTPSYAGGSARVDFLLPEIATVVEVKMTRPGLTARKVSDELILDIARYSSHPSCNSLHCIIYDPECTIANPRGIERDLARNPSRLFIRTMIVT